MPQNNYASNNRAKPKRAFHLWCLVSLCILSALAALLVGALIIPLFTRHVVP